MKIKKTNTYIVACLLIAFVKIWFIANNEIVATPYDAETYVTRTLNALWDVGLVHSGYPIWLYITHQIGFPQRISIEILYLASCFFVATSVKEYIHYVAATLIFFVLAFAPFTYFLFDRALGDGFYLCLTLIAFGFSLKLLSRTQLKIKAIVIYASCLGFTLGVMLVTRTEDQLIFFWIFAITVLFAFFCRMQGAAILTLSFWRRPFCILLFSSGVSLLVVNMVCAIFYVKSGVYARSLPLLPGHFNLQKKLAMIDSGIPQDRYISISAASRKLAYDVSPTLSSLRDEVENTNNILHASSRQAGLPNGEIGSAWIWWSFLGSIYKTIPNPSPVTVEKAFRKINDELDSAFTDGRLRRRFIINPLIGGNMPQLFANFPSGILTVLRKVFSSVPYVSDQINNSDIFNKTCLRRAALIGHPNRIILQGWAFAALPHKKILLIVPRTLDGGLGKTTHIGRADVTNGFTKSNGWKPEVYGFQAEIEATSLQDVTLTYFLSDGTTVDSNKFSKGQVLTIGSNAHKNSNVIQGIDVAGLDPTNVRSGIRHEMQKTLVQYMKSNAAILLASTISIAFIILMIIRIVINKKSNLIRNIFVLQFFILLIFGARIIFYSLIETASWHIGIRYLASSQALFFVFISCSLAAIVTAARDRIFRKL